MTPRVDEDVARLFRSLGRGYPAKINLVGFLHARLAECRRRNGSTSWLGARSARSSTSSTWRDGIGDTEAEMAETA